MGNQDAPKAPAGWYPIEEGKPGEQYWDGKSWTGETKGLRIDSGNNSPEPITGKLNTKQNRILVWSFSAVLAILLAIIAVSGTQENSNSCEKGSTCYNAKLASGEIEPERSGSVEGVFGEETSTNSSTTQWQPSGFSVFNEDLAFMWVEGGPDPCGSISCRYFTMDVTSHFGCPNGVYVELNMTSGGVVVDWSNDTVPALAAGQTAQLQFITYEENVDSGQVAKMSCH